MKDKSYIKILITIALYCLVGFVDAHATETELHISNEKIVLRSPDSNQPLGKGLDKDIHIFGKCVNGYIYIITISPVGVDANYMLVPHKKGSHLPLQLVKCSE